MVELSFIRRVTDQLDNLAEASLELEQESRCIETEKILKWLDTAMEPNRLAKFGVSNLGKLDVSSALSKAEYYNALYRRVKVQFSEEGSSETYQQRAVYNSGMLTRLIREHSTKSKGNRFLIQTDKIKEAFIEFWDSYLEADVSIRELPVEFKRCLLPEYRVFIARTFDSLIDPIRHTRTLSIGGEKTLCLISGYVGILSGGWRPDWSITRDELATCRNYIHTTGVEFRERLLRGKEEFPLINKPETELIVPGPDFRSVRWGDQIFTFTKNQAPIVRGLYDAWKLRTYDVGGEYLLELVDPDDSESSCRSAPPARMNSLFRDHPAWTTMIVSGGTKGAYRLADPPDKIVARAKLIT